MRTWLSYVLIGIMWCLVVLGVIKLIELVANRIHSRQTQGAAQGALAPFTCFEGLNIEPDP
jgi:hypothetical protein